MFRQILLCSIAVVVLSGCAAKAKIVDGEIILKCIGACEAEFKDGEKIKKGLISFPPIRVNP